MLSNVNISGQDFNYHDDNLIITCMCTTATHCKVLNPVRKTKKGLKMKHDGEQNL